MLKVVEEPTIDLLEETKEYLRVSDADSDTLITTLINSSISYVQDYTNRQLGATTFELLLSHLDESFYFLKSPVQSISKIEYMDETGTYQTFDASKYYLFEEDGLGKIELSESLDHIEHKYAVKITFIAGYATVPDPIKAWIFHNVGVLFDGEETTVSKFADKALDQYKVSMF